MMMSTTHPNWSRTLRLAGLASALVALTACGSVREELGLAKNAPDEFAVVTKAPLVMPPDYSLRPPQPGAPATRQPSATEQARAALTGTTPTTQGQSALLDQAGATRADPDIRAKVEGENRELATKSQTFSDQILFGGSAQPAPAAPAAQQAGAENVTPETTPIATPVATPAPSEGQAPAEATPASESYQKPTEKAPQAQEEEDGWFDWF